MTAPYAAFRAWAVTDGRLAPRTAEKSVRYLMWLAKHGAVLEPLVRAEALDLLTRARDDGVSPQTLNLWVVHLNRWARFSGAEWKLPHFRHSHVAAVPAPTREEARRLWNLSWTDPSTNARNRAILAVLMDKGPRRQEVVDLNLSDRVRTRTGWALVIRRGKGEKERAIALNEETDRRLGEYVSRYRIPSDPRAMFTTPRGRVSHQYVGKIVSDAGARVGLPWISCHKLRHFATDDLLDRGVKIQAVAYVLGHESMETTMLYRSKRLNAIQAESEVRLADRGRFRHERTISAQTCTPDTALPPTKEGADNRLTPTLRTVEKKGSDTPEHCYWRSGHGGIRSPSGGHTSPVASGLLLGVA